jgi:class 3 adenylate cyclase
MDWNYERAKNRIDSLINQHPRVVVESIDQRLNLIRESEGFIALAARDALISIPRNKAVVVDGVHVYARLSNYDDYRLESGSETEASHKRALASLHLLYAAMDRVVQDFGAQRVDYHGSRLHCVIVDPVGNEQERVLKALALSEALQRLARMSARDIGGLDFDLALKIGIDTGQCVAINDGKGCEQEPLFLGSAANYAAKLADGPGQGIFLSGRVRAIVGLAPLGGLSEESSFPLGSAQFNEFRQRAYVAGVELSSQQAGDDQQAGRLLEEWRRDLREHRAATAGPNDFKFHVHTPPLKSIKYDDLSPSNSIRMPVASIFADLDGYTAYIDRCMASGRADEAVRALHVLRGEFHNVLRTDFNSRKVRYVGDCIHGIMAFGTGSAVDLPQTTREAIKCAAGLQGSFEIVQQLLGNLDDLGLATGIEIGPTPVSRIGIRGNRSVRVASSTATIQSQCEQERVAGSGIAIGPEARRHLSLSAKRHFQDGVLLEPDYNTIAYILGLGAAVAAVPADTKQQESEPELREHSAGAPDS